MLLASRRIMLPLFLLVPALVQHALAFPAATSPAHELLIVRNDDPSTSAPNGHCTELEERNHAAVASVEQVIEKLNKKGQLSVFWKNVDKLQLMAALASIVGEAALGRMMFQDEMASTDGLLALPTALVSLLGGIKALGDAMDTENTGGWKSRPGIDILNFGTQISIWTVCIILVFESILVNGFNGVQIPHHFSMALTVHSSFLALNLVQGAWEIAKDSHLASGTGRLLDSLTLNGWRVSAATKRMMSGVINVASRILRRQMTQVDQTAGDHPTLDHFVPLTRELARMAIEVGAVSQCIEDSASFHDRTSKIRKGKMTAEQCRQEWKNKLGHIYQESGNALGNEDAEVGLHAEMIRLTTMQEMTGTVAGGENGMLQTIVMDAVGNVAPIVIFASMMAFSDEQADIRGMEAGTAILGAASLLQVVFLRKASKALLQMFREIGEDNPKAKELAKAIDHELKNGELKEWGDRGVEIDVMVFTSSTQGYDRHQGRFSIHNCPDNMRNPLETKLLSLATKAKVLRPEVFLDTPHAFFGKMFRYSYVDDVRLPSSTNVRRDQGGARVMTRDAFFERFKNIDVGILWENVRSVNHASCSSPLRPREEQHELPWSSRLENREEAIAESVEHLEEDPRW